MAKSSCAKHHIQAKKLERLVRTSLVFDHYPRMEDEDADKVNVGGIVSNYANKNKYIATENAWRIDTVRLVKSMRSDNQRTTQEE